MFYNTPTTRRPRRQSFFTIALTPLQMLGNLIETRRTRAALWRLDDHMLKDIGLSRSGIESAIRKGQIRD
jgi:uncharacterized protein YjiS (DUF1127 family)